MKVLLLKPINKKYFVIQPNLGLGYLARILKENNAQVCIIDSGKEKLTWEKFANLIKEEKYDIVGIQMFGHETRSVKKHVEIIKEFSPKTVVFIGGAHISAAPELTMKEIIMADFGFVGEAEAGFEAFLKLKKEDYSDPAKLEAIHGLIWRNSGEIVVNPKKLIENLDEIKFPAWELMQPGKYPVMPHGTFTKRTPVAPIIISRGCPYHCTYCSARNVSGTAMRFRSVENVMEELIILYDKYGVKEVHIADDNFTSNKQYVLNFCRSVIDSKLDLAFALPNGVRLNSLDEEMLIAMEKAGFYSMAVGVEAGSDRILKLMKKGLTVNLIKEKTDLIKKVTNINVTGFFIIGYIEETEEEILNTIEFAKSLKIDKANFNIMNPYPGTEVWEKYVQRNKGDINWDGYFWYKAVDNVSDIPAKRLKEFQKKAVMEFYLRPMIIINLIKEIKSFSQLRALVNRSVGVFFPAFNS